MIFILNSKVPEDENKRERKDEKFEDQEEVDMNDETYGQNEPPEPEDLDMNADDEIGDGDNDNDENPDELPVEVFLTIRVSQKEVDWEMAVLQPFLAIFLAIILYLSQNWDSDGHFEVHEGSKS